MSARFGRRCTWRLIKLDKENGNVFNEGASPCDDEGDGLDSAFAPSTGVGGIMSLLCRIGIHAPAPGEIWNDGLYFGHCERCSCHLIRNADGPWTSVPAGYRVVWRHPPVGYPAWGRPDPSPREDSFLAWFQRAPTRRDKVSIARTLLPAPREGARPPALTGQRSCGRSAAA